MHISKFVLFAHLNNNHKNIHEAFFRNVYIYVYWEQDNHSSIHIINRMYYAGAGQQRVNYNDMCTLKSNPSRRNQVLCNTEWVKRVLQKRIIQNNRNGLFGEP